MTQDEALAIWEYRDGHLYWRETIGARAQAGALAGSLCRKNGNTDYWEVQCKGMRLLAHRMIFLMHRGYLPEEIDHIDGDGLNNDIENLRPCTRAQNQHNMGVRKGNGSGYKGVDFHKKKQRWRARIRANSRRFNLGYFESAELAHEAYKAAATKLHKEFARFA